MPAESSSSINLPQYGTESVMSIPMLHRRELRFHVLVKPVVEAIDSEHASKFTSKIYKVSIKITERPLAEAAVRNGTDTK